ncbi:MAG: hypothetical protein SWO11_16975 [Thermodesulfobacteriota bacterium]|nr:hypothetical protein [Thermodesulfobacteriota bacterium]
MPGMPPIRPYDPTRSLGLITFESNADIKAREDAEIEAKRLAEEDLNSPVITSLASHIDICWNAAKRAKKDIEIKLLDCLRRRKGEYSADVLAKIENSGLAKNFAKLTDKYCRAAVSWLKDILLPAGEKPYSVAPTPIPDLPAQVEEDVIGRMQTAYSQVLMVYGQQIASNIDWQELQNQMKDEAINRIKEQAKEDATAITKEIEDDFIEGGWYEALEEFLDDLVAFPAAFIGKSNKYQKQPEWRDGQLIIVDKIIDKYERKNPFDMYPSPGAKSLNDGYLFELMRLRRSDLNDLIGVEGYNEEAIRLVLSQYASGYKISLNNDTEKAELENRPEENIDPEGVLDTLVFWGPVQGKTLIEWGMDKENIPDPDIDYHIKAYKIAEIVIGAILNPHPLGKRDYFTASFENNNDSVWGNCIPLIMDYLQDICNSCVRAIVNNLGITSGFQMWYNVDRINPGQNMDVSPFKKWAFTADEMGGSSDPLGFFQPDSNVDELLNLYKALDSEASEVTSIPKYMYGSEKVGGAGRTASGLSMLMNSASKGFRLVVRNVDKGIIKPSVYDKWLYIMINEPEKARGDMNIIARASEYLVIMEQLQMRRMEFLRDTANQFDMGILGIEGRAEVLREVVKSLKMNTNKILPESDDILRNKEYAQIQMMLQNIAQATGYPIEQLMMIATNRSAGATNEGNGNKPGLAALDASGQPVSGQDFSLM